MIDIKLIRESPKLVKENIRKKFQEEKIELVDRVIELDAKWRKEKKKADDLRSERNKISEKINQLMKDGGKSEAKKFIVKAKEIPKKIDKSEEKTRKLVKEINKILNIFFNKICMNNFKNLFLILLYF